MVNVPTIAVRFSVLEKALDYVAVFGDSQTFARWLVSAIVPLAAVQIVDIVESKCLEGPFFQQVLVFEKRPLRVAIRRNSIFCLDDDRVLKTVRSAGD